MLLVGKLCRFCDPPLLLQSLRTVAALRYGIPREVAVLILAFQGEQCDTLTVTSDTCMKVIGCILRKVNEDCKDITNSPRMLVPLELQGTTDFGPNRKMRGFLFLLDCQHMTIHGYQLFYYILNIFVLCYQIRFEEFGSQIG